MLAVPDAANFLDYRKSLPTTGAEKVTFLVDAVNHFTFLDKTYSLIPGGISFYARKDLPNLVKNKALATGFLCTNRLEGDGVLGHRAAPTYSTYMGSIINTVDAKTGRGIKAWPI